jgi:hypothetical protein
MQDEICCCFRGLRDRVREIGRQEFILPEIIESQLMVSPS